MNSDLHLDSQQMAELVMEHLVCGARFEAAWELSYQLALETLFLLDNGS